MSMQVLIIALAPAVITLMIGVAAKNRFILFVAAVIAGAVGVLTGNPAYMMADLFFVVIAFFFGLSIIGNQNLTAQQKPLPVVSAPVAAENKNEDSTWIWIVVGLIFVGFLLNDKKADRPALAQPIQIQQKNQELTDPSPPLPPLYRPERYPQLGKNPSSDMRHCLDLSSNGAIQKCANQSR